MKIHNEITITGLIEDKFFFIGQTQKGASFARFNLLFVKDKTKFTVPVIAWNFGVEAKEKFINKHVEIKGSLALSKNPKKNTFYHLISTEDISLIKI